MYFFQRSLQRCQPLNTARSRAGWPRFSPENEAAYCGRLRPSQYPTFTLFPHSIVVYAGSLDKQKTGCRIVRVRKSFVSPSTAWLGNHQSIQAILREILDLPEFDAVIIDLVERTANSKDIVTRRPGKTRCRRHLFHQWAWMGDKSLLKIRMIFLSHFFRQPGNTS